MLHMAQPLVNPVGVCFFTAHSVNWGRKERKRRAEERREGGVGGVGQKGRGRGRVEKRTGRKAARGS